MPKQLTGLILLAGFCMMLTGCGKGSPPSSYYILTSSSQMTSAIQPIEDISVGVGPVSIPGYLDRSQIVTTTGSNSITIHEYQRWGNSFKAQVEETLAENISILLQTPQVTVFPWERALRPKYQVFLTIRKFEGEATGNVTLDAIWQIANVRTDKSLLTRRFMQSFPVAGNNMSAYVQTQSNALDALSKEIVKGLEAVAHSK
ncbi:membrane integrity-associated transporter subunit PqiC [Halodesulfovibrio sp.]|uniref:PqiC family protein n=1 Tax=Halodesulfovibrio sp. TaxID=1912772 RepID=UPI0025F98113|nr:PqiC family protein [Halodesulfovibrio sp.]MCT4534664.1 PqiC family protein [Halodesulfovibrio sp.]